ncbi:MAG: 23S rRNA pseudouridine(1911/1915/1917) synthase RluD [Gammaproteobacteria bacterium]|jgi:23S rRNA pseudouridine1911/1915/1917 synthase|nr:23S rRNA pseudouridine(1911/1915/1917) synthase RluD [Gammaproteobacteria bacterium]
MSSINIELIVPPHCAGERLDRVAALLLPDFSRAELARWITAGELTVDGRVVKPRNKVSGGEHLILVAQRSLREAWQEPQALMLNVIYEDEDILVINKPAGLVVHPGAGNPSGTLVNGLLHHRPDLTRLPRAGVVHRLDKETSGVMVVAGSEIAQLRLTRMIAARKVRREYVCLCEGRMVAGQTIDRAIGRDPHVRTRQAIREEGKHAVTVVRIRKRYRAHTLVDAHLETGRTHQIRVHMQSIGYPLVGDRRYGARGKVPKGASSALVSTLHGFPRQALHAWQLAFTHPASGMEVSFEAPWPKDIIGLASALDADLVEGG